MAKINATYHAGYYTGHDFDAGKEEDDRLEERNRERKRERKGGDAEQRSTRQTMMLPFSIICSKCESRIVRGVKLYANVKKLKEKFMNKYGIYSLQILCIHCTNTIVLKTDPENADYVVASGAKRVAGDWAEERKREAEAKEREEEEKASDALAAHSTAVARIKEGQDLAKREEALTAELQSVSKQYDSSTLNRMEAMLKASRDEEQQQRKNTTRKVEAEKGNIDELFFTKQFSAVEEEKQPVGPPRSSDYNSPPSASRRRLEGNETAQGIRAPPSIRPTLLAPTVKKVEGKEDIARNEKDTAGSSPFINFDDLLGTDALGGENVDSAKNAGGVSRDEKESTLCSPSSVQQATSKSSQAATRKGKGNLLGKFADY